MSKPNEKKLRKQRERKDRLKRQRLNDQQSFDAESRIREAEALGRDKRWAKCADACRKMLRYQPGNLRITELYALASCESGYYAEELWAARKLADAMPASRRYRSNVYISEFRNRH